MNKKLVLVAAVAAVACACQPKVDAQPNKQDNKPKGGCCESERAKPAAETPAVAVQPAPAVQQTQTVSTPEVKVEASKVNK